MQITDSPSPCLFLLLIGGVTVSVWAAVAWQLAVGRPRRRAEKARLTQNFRRNFQVGGGTQKPRESPTPAEPPATQAERPRSRAEAIAAPGESGNFKRGTVARSAPPVDRAGKPPVSRTKFVPTGRPPPLRLDQAKIDAILRDARARNLELEIPDHRAERSVRPAPVPVAMPATAQRPPHPPKMNQPALKLDEAKIDLFKRETEAVQATIAEAMNLGRAEHLRNSERFSESTAPSRPSHAPHGPATVTSEAGPAQDISSPSHEKSPAAASRVIETSDPSLPSRYAAFYQALLSRDQCTVAEADRLARQHGHMLSGALDAINEWGTERFGGPLFFLEGNQLLLERERLN